MIKVGKLNTPNVLCFHLVVTVTWKHRAAVNEIPVCHQSLADKDAIVVVFEGMYRLRLNLGASCGQDRPWAETWMFTRRSSHWRWLRFPSALLSSPIWEFFYRNVWGGKQKCSHKTCMLYRSLPDSELWKKKRVCHDDFDHPTFPQTHLLNFISRTVKDAHPSWPVWFIRCSVSQTPLSSVGLRHNAAVVVFLGSCLWAKLNEWFSAFTSICANEKESSHTPTHDHIFKSLQTLHPSAFFVFQ